jgi:hypothetical protein
LPLAYAGDKKVKRFHQAVPEELHDEDIIKDEIMVAVSRLKQEPAKYLPVSKDEIAKQCRQFDHFSEIIGRLPYVRATVTESGINLPLTSQNIVHTESGCRQYNSCAEAHTFWDIHERLGRRSIANLTCSSAAIFARA